jgi:DNA-binding MltR family transcriptional regulator
MKGFFNSLGMISYTLLILFFAPKPIVKKLFSIKMSQAVASNKLERGPLRDYETGFCSLLALTVLEKKIFKDLAMFFVFLPMCDLEMKVEVKYYD